MKIAVASEGRMVAQHFGHCGGFNLFKADNGRVSDSEYVQNPGHRPGFLPNFLNEMGVNVIISGGMGGGAIEIFDEKGIQVVTGASGDAQDAVNRFLAGELKSNGSICNEHQHQHGDSCGRHS